MAVTLETNFWRLHHIIKEDFREELGNLGIVNIGSLDFHLNILLLIGEKFKDFAILLEVGLRSQEGQRLLDGIFVSSDVLYLSVINQQNGNIAWSGLELANPLQKEECFENPESKRIVQIFCGLQDGCLHIAPQRRGDAIEHPVECGQTSNILISQ